MDTKRAEAAERRADAKRRNNRARHAATMRMIAAYPELWDQLFAEEAARVGVKPTGRRKGISRGDAGA